MDSEEVDLLGIANTLYSLLGQGKEIKSEDELYSDKVYLNIISALIPNIQEEITPGKTPEEKIETIGLLLSLLGKLLEADLDIDPKKIVIDKDKESAKNFLDILLEVTTSLMNSGAEFEEDEDEFEEKKMNISFGKRQKKRKKRKKKGK